MNNIPTAEELLLEIMGCLKMDYSLVELNEADPSLVPFLVEQINNRTKLHVQAALKSAAEKVELKAYSYTGCFECGREDMSVDEKSILNAYPENLIQ